MKKPLNQAVKTKMSQHTLSAKHLSELQQRIQTSEVRPAVNHASRFKLAGLLAAVFFTALFTAMLLPHMDAPEKQSMVQLIANEVVKNHLNLKPLEVHTNDIDSLIHYFTQLDFLLRPSREVNDFKDRLMGGRYCSLQGITAAQLRLKTQTSSKANTLYQTEYRKAVFGPLPDIDRNQKPLVAWAKGIKVRIWVEKGVLFAMTDISQTNDK